METQDAFGFTKQVAVKVAGKENLSQVNQVRTYAYQDPCEHTRGKTKVCSDN